MTALPVALPTRKPPVSVHVFFTTVQPVGKMLSLKSSQNKHDGLMVMLNAAEPVQPLLSVAVTVKLEVPVAVGVPVMLPLAAFKLKPAGREPAVTAKVTGFWPPLELMSPL